MENSVQQIKEARKWAEQALAEAVARNLPIVVAVVGIHLYCDQHGLPQPDDAIAFATGGEVTAKMVKDWSSPYGGN